MGNAKCLTEIDSTEQKFMVCHFSWGHVLSEGFDPDWCGVVGYGRRWWSWSRPARQSSPSPFPSTSSSPSTPPAPPLTTQSVSLPLPSYVSPTPILIFFQSHPRWLFRYQSVADGRKASCLRTPSQLYENKTVDGINGKTWNIENYNLAEIVKELISKVGLIIVAT